MKQRAGELDEEMVFRIVAETIVEQYGAPLKQITRESRITEDIGAYGEDGGDIIRALDRWFEMDWRDLRTDIHFGVEAFGPPMPWVRDSAARYEPQPLTVGRLVDELRSGVWSDTALVRIPEERLATVIGCGWAQVALFVVILTWTILWAVN